MDARGVFERKRKSRIVKHLRLTGHPDREVAPPSFALLAESPHVEEARLLSWNPSDSRGMTGLYAIDGDRDAVIERLAENDEIVALEAASVGSNAFYLLLTLQLEGHPVLCQVFEWITADGLIVQKPIIYRDGNVHARLVGPTDVIQGVIERLPTFVDVDVHEIGEGGFRTEQPLDSLSERQREAIETALSLGYYDESRNVTHEDIASAIGIAPSTAS
ncbi:MAG: helix-turn-helix domain-containing protein, partial [Halobacteriaceae archaeon]